jgi:hypothetical protein
MRRQWCSHKNRSTRRLGIRDESNQRRLVLRQYRRLGCQSALGHNQSPLYDRRGQPMNRVRVREQIQSTTATTVLVMVVMGCLRVVRALSVSLTVGRVTVTRIRGMIVAARACVRSQVNRSIIRCEPHRLGGNEDRQEAEDDKRPDRPEDFRESQHWRGVKSQNDRSQPKIRSPKLRPNREVYERPFGRTRGVPIRCATQNFSSDRVEAISSKQDLPLGHS